MAAPLTYPPEIVIESTIDLPPEYDVLGHEGMGVEVCCELAMGRASDGVSSVYQKLQLGFPAGSSVRNTPPTEVIATVTSLAGLSGSWLMPMWPFPKSTKPCPLLYT